MGRSWVQLELAPASGFVPAGRVIPSRRGSGRLPLLRALARSQRIASNGRMGPFSLFVLSLSFAVILALGSVIFNSGFSSGPTITASLTDISWDSWLPRLGNSNHLVKNKLLVSQVRYLSELARSRLTNQDARELAMSIVAESQRANIDPLFVAAVIKSESAFKHQAKSEAGAMGLMQLLPSTGEYISKVTNIDWHGSGKLNDPQYNLRLGIAYIKYLRDLFNGNLEYALIAYNWGPANLQQALSQRDHIPYSTINYARTIINNHAKWKKDFTSRRAKLENSSFLVG